MPPTRRRRIFGVDARIIVGRVGKWSPISAERCGPQQGVAQGVYGDITVRMGDAPLRVGDLDASEDEPQAVGQDMHVVTVSDSEIRHNVRF